MEKNIHEALRAKSNAEKLFAVKDFAAARNYALEAQMLCPELEGISQMVATFDVYRASERKFDGEFDFYSILGLNPSADKSTVKKQYKKMAVLLHPDKNKTVGAEGAFKLVSEAWTLLSDNAKRNSYDVKRNKQLAYGVLQTSVSSIHGVGGTTFEKSSQSVSSHSRRDTFWTICTSCHVQYEYLRKYVNKKLSCKNCRGVFIAVETGPPPVDGAFSYGPWPYATENGYGTHAYNGMAYIPNSTVCRTGNVVPAIHSGHGSECAPNVSFQWSGPTGMAVEHKNLTAKSSNVLHQSNGNMGRTKFDRKYMGSNGHTGFSEPRTTKLGRPPKKKLKVDAHDTTQNEIADMAWKTESEVKLNNVLENMKYNSRIPPPGDKRWSVAPAFDARKLLIDKARTVIRTKLEEMRLASASAEKAHKEAAMHGEGSCKAEKSNGANHQSELNKAPSMPITVPDSDFHDFDKDRSEECFKQKQIWALYDEEDGMPRLYCLIREVLSVRPFKVCISYLSSKTDTEFGSVNWLDSGFTKSCGNFRSFNTDYIDQVNMFSHLLSGEKTGRGGCVKIYPKRGDIWAVYRNWSSDWNRTTPDHVRHQYEMVEVLEDYSEELGVWVTPLIKLNGYKTVYQRNTIKDAVRWIPRREMLRFSHQVPSCVLKEKGTNLPDGCWDLDPAATPDELLRNGTEVHAETPREIFHHVTEVQVDKKQPSHQENLAFSPDNILQKLDKVKVEKTPAEVLQDLNELQAENTQNCAVTEHMELHPVPEVQVEGKSASQVDSSGNLVEHIESVTEIHSEKKWEVKSCDATPVELPQTEMDVEVESYRYFQAGISVATPTNIFQEVNDAQPEEIPNESEK